jgi:hypothetical protein
MKKWIVGLILFGSLLITSQVEAQSIVQTYLDPCDSKVYVVNIPINSTGVVVIIRNRSKVFSYAEFQSGEVALWVSSIFSTPCPIPAAVTQTIQNTVTQSAATASQAAASASNAAAAAAASVPPPPTVATPSTGSSTPATSSSSSSSSSSSNSSSESKTETKTETKTEEKKTETKSEEKKEESKSEEKKEEKKEDQKEEEKKEEEKKEEKKKEEKKRPVNPPLVSANIASGLTPDGKITNMMTVGLSKSSLTGAESYGATFMLWDNLQQFNLSLNYTKIFTDENYKPIVILASSVSAASMFGVFSPNITNSMVLLGPNQIVAGYALTFAGTFAEGNTSIAQIATAFITKPFAFKRVTVSPMFAWSNLGSLYMVETKTVMGVETYNYIIGSNFDFNLTKRFKVNLGVLAIGSTDFTQKPSYNFTIGSRFAL